MGVQHRGLDLDEPHVVQALVEGVGDDRAFAEGLADGGVGNKIKVLRV